ncbi:MAG: acetyl-CoA carboxylase biotin carboxylase subunit [Deltaproteobacteria bacterium]|nr:acetyl-CoA carboxylase biotin carboxylase subunit [Deltaproteobacteria bacterium]
MTAIPFETLLIANRGEIAVRVIRACRALGIRSVAVYSDVDRTSPHVALADAAVAIGPAAPLESYLNVERILDAARATGAQAIHPGYGFLAENAAFARAVAAAGITFVGPSPEAMEAMGDKLGARRTMSRLGIPIVPGSDPDADPPSLPALAAGIGFPLLVKAAGGGGGRGMRRVDTPDQLQDALTAASREAQAAFGDPRVYLERVVERARHVEVQVLGDRHGNVVHVYERECSLQRRFQKVIEEAPAPNLAAAVRQGLLDSAVRAAQSVRYEGAGSVEFLVEGDRFYFLEMNTRLQVEHPVSEIVCGIDLVEQQIRIAAGQALPFRQEDIRVRGHAIEARICAEDPARGFAPSPGRIACFVEPGGAGVRCDSGVLSGGVVPAEYDALIAKVIGYGADRHAALDVIAAALRELVVLGVTTNAEFLSTLLADPDVLAGSADTQLVTRRYSDWLPAPVATDADSPELVAAALALHFRTPTAGGGRAGAAAAPGVASPWQQLAGWRTGRGAS